MQIENNTGSLIESINSNNVGDDFYSFSKCYPEGEVLS